MKGNLLHTAKRYEVLLSWTVVLLLGGGCWALTSHVFSRAHQEATESNQYEANGYAIKKALGFLYTALVEGNGDKYIYKGAEILQVDPGGPFDKAGLKQQDRIPLSPSEISRLLLQNRGKTATVPVVRRKHRFNVTVVVPRFPIPFPGLKY